MFIARTYADVRNGVFSDWKGNGATKFIPQSTTDGELLINKKYGVPEYYLREYEAPKTLKQLDAKIIHIEG